MKLNYLLLAIPLLLYSCSGETKIIIEGSIVGKESETIYLDRLDVEKLIRVDSVKVSEKGEFRFKIESNSVNFYQLGFNSLEFITILPEPGERVEIQFTGDRLQEEYRITGSEGSEKLRQLDMKLFSTLKSLDSLQKAYDSSIGTTGFESSETELTEAYLNKLKEQRRYNIVFVIENISSLVAVKALYQRIDDETYVLYDPKDLQYLKIVSDSLNKYYPDSPHTKALKENVQNEMNRFYMSQLAGTTREISPTDLDIKLPDTTGKVVSLSSLKGKNVLLTFWSARSKESIALNLELKEYYKKYKNRGLEIYAVNIDDEELWLRAVRFDELPWINVREADPSMPLSARLYNVTELPSLFLIDKDGIVQKRDIYGRNLQIALDQIFGN